MQINMKLYASLMIFELKNKKTMPESIKQELISYKESIDKYHRGVRFYEMPLEHLLFIQAKEYAQKYKRFVRFDYNVDARYDKKDMEKAVGYIPIPNRICFEYDDSDDVFEPVCNKCYINKQVRDLEIRPYGAIKKYANEYASFYNEENDAFIVSKLLYKSLLDNGINQKYFRPVYTRKDKKTPLAFQIVSESCILEGGLIDKNYNLSICEVCGNQSRLYAHKKSYAPKIITEQALNQMKDVNMTYEYYGQTRMLVISKALYELIIEKDKKAKFLPVFLEEY